MLLGWAFQQHGIPVPSKHCAREACVPDVMQVTKKFTASPTERFLRRRGERTSLAPVGC